jgi:alpha-L-arabinofuranosidase
MKFGASIQFFVRIILLLLASSAPPIAAETAHLSIDASKAGARIDRNLFGQFAENIGHGIYEGIWVGPDSSIPNTCGVRNDAVAALRELKVPNVRWPGGCFADQYHWRKGTGPRDKRPAMVNSAWGDVIAAERADGKLLLEITSLDAESPAASDTYPLDVSAAFSEDRKTLTFAVLNPSDAEQSIRIAINGAKLASAGKLWRMAPDSIDATVQVDKKPEVQVEDQTLGTLPEVLTVRPISVNIYSYPVQ